MMISGLNTRGLGEGQPMFDEPGLELGLTGELGHVGEVAGACDALNQCTVPGTFEERGNCTPIAVVADENGRGFARHAVGGVGPRSAYS